MTVEQLQRELDLSDASLERMRSLLRETPEDDPEPKLLAWLEAAWLDYRDRYRFMGRQGGFVESTFAAIRVSDPDPEPESVPAEYEDKCGLDARTRRAENGERAKEEGRKQIRSFNQELRERLNRGENVGPIIARVMRELREAA